MIIIPRKTLVFYVGNSLFYLTIRITKRVLEKNELQPLWLELFLFKKDGHTRNLFLSLLILFLFLVLLILLIFLVFFVFILLAHLILLHYSINSTLIIQFIIHFFRHYFKGICARSIISPPNPMAVISMNSSKISSKTK